MTSRVMPNPIENDEEFFATLVTNIYSSEKNRPLRDGHHGVPELMRPNSWLNGPLFHVWIHRFGLQMLDFANRIAMVRTRFNPFHDAPIPAHSI
jgi:hypothetical protein